jgi:hypothetical protein
MIWCLNAETVLPASTCALDGPTYHIICFRYQVVENCVWYFLTPCCFTDNQLQAAVFLPSYVNPHHVHPTVRYHGPFFFLNYSLCNPSPLIIGWTTLCPASPPRLLEDIIQPSQSYAIPSQITQLRNKMYECIRLVVWSVVCWVTEDWNTVNVDGSVTSVWNQNARVNYM